MWMLAGYPIAGGFWVTFDLICFALILNIKIYFEILFLCWAENKMNPFYSLFHIFLNCAYI